jgi:hypothetical protein
MHSTTLPQPSISTPAPARPRTPLPFRSPVALHSYHPNPTHDSSAPRRQLDGGVPPVADRRGGGQARPQQRDALVVGAAARSWLLLAHTASARRSRQRASSVRRRRRGRHCQDAAMASVTGVRRAVSTQPVRRPGSGCPAGCCPPRPVSGHLGGRPASGSPAGCCPRVRCPLRPVSGPLVSTRPLSSRLVSTRPDASVFSHTGQWCWDQAGAAGQPSPREPVEVPVGCRAVGRLGPRPSRPGGGRRCRGRTLVGEDRCRPGRVDVGGGSGRA